MCPGDAAPWRLVGVVSTHHRLAVGGALLGLVTASCGRIQSPKEMVTCDFQLCARSSIQRPHTHAHSTTQRARPVLFLWVCVLAESLLRRPPDHRRPQDEARRARRVWCHAPAQAVRTSRRSPEAAITAKRAQAIDNSHDHDGPGAPQTVVWRVARQSTAMADAASHAVRARAAGVLCGELGSSGANTKHRERKANTPACTVDGHAMRRDDDPRVSRVC